MVRKESDHMNEVTKERLKAVVTILVTAVVNVLNVYGFAVDLDNAVNVVLSILSAITILYSWWKNQNVTREAVAAQGFLKQLKADKAIDEE